MKTFSLQWTFCSMKYELVTLGQMLDLKRILQLPKDSNFIKLAMVDFSVSQEKNQGFCT